MASGGGRGETWLLANELIEVARADTSYADLYLEHARALVATELTQAQYSELETVEQQLGELTRRIAAAVDAREWQLVHQLTSTVVELKRRVTDRGPIRSVAARVYGAPEVLIDPFSPGLSGLAGVAAREVPVLRDAAVKRLERLGSADPGWRELYEARRKALLELRVTPSPTVTTGAESAVATLQARLHRALAEGDLMEVGRLSAKLAEAEGSAPAQGTGEGAAAVEDVGGAADAALTGAFPREACDRARELGLAPVRLESAVDELRARFRPRWSVTAGDPSGNTLRLAMTIPADTDEALRDVLALFTTRAILTSAGTRYVPSCAEEDLLVETFDEGAPAPTSPLLSALGLRARTGISRRRLEGALRERGTAVVREIGLDARAYRLVCVPPDVYARLGAKVGWGKHELWTHFDGYLASNERKLMPLAGGDARFGGVNDLVAVGAEYGSERLVVRLAIVRRRRFLPW